MTKSEPKKQRGWLNKSEMAASLGISVQAFDKWGVEPVERIGREAFYNCRSVVANRLGRAEEKHQPPGDEDLDPLAEHKLTQEKLRLTAAQADGQELKNEITRRKSVPTEFATFVLSRLAAEIGSLLDTLPLTLKRRHPDLETRHIDSVQRELAKARNRAATLDDRLPGLLNEYLDTADS
ncbi:Phage DNA packaging protein, Nu1 subunit of terminase [Halopseudomonas xinjiangensis]|uniref:Phage DNA packaging protein, Nu1 subunit of terminase n=1 Tax=Halopseudomonas xinjiangensis TaxID=487184 RepID=A0A1H1QBT5_9GAMM|nr:terminase small subunit [Halopseudomonas xinjiangensis]SDS20890.1 Phage DNA packaging protein, Nu1 subunit of terminase [Halopseudomonas xinjiangensis]